MSRWPETMTCDEYDALPDAIRMIVSRREYQFMSDSQKADLLRAETEPEIDD